MTEDQTVHAILYQDGRQVGKLTNEAIIPEFEASEVFEVERV